MIVHEIMTTQIEACSPKDPLSRAAAIMWDQDIGCVPVVDEGRHVVGMLTDRDVCMAAYTKGLPLAAILVEAAMADKIVSCSPKDMIEDAVELMARHELHRLPVVDQDVLVGILAMNDLIRCANDLSPRRELVLDALAEISRPRRELQRARSAS